MLKALFYKDLRIVKPILVLLAVATPLTFVAIAGICFYSMHSERSHESILATVFHLSLQISIYASYLSIAFVCSTVLTAERQDRSIEFLSYLPPLRLHILLSKLALVALCLVACLSLFGCLRVLLEYFQDFSTEVSGRDIGAGDAIGMWVGCAGASWFIGSFSKSTGLPALAGILSPMLVIAAVQISLHMTESSMSLDTMQSVVSNSVLLFGLAGFISGSLFFLNGDWT
ncbi:ABC-2 family transporter protein [Rubripirellula lacrimiformis]|uniref:ABC-2 family transporter protein n=2 Tax=Rubripirellula lacrimiformis TaxID=1930273 RepID=A0A517N5G0_9BACT|nr:ABC-2 family transporter protein [Rubripirellula lacrimiformis]